MKLFSQIQQRIGIKLFVSYLMVIFIGFLVLAVSAEFIVPSTFEHHMGSMMGNNWMGMDMMGMNMMDGKGPSIFDSFRQAFNEALIRAALVAFIAAMVVSIFVSQRVTAPVRDMMAASRFIADGHYDQRVDVVGALDDGDELNQLAISFNQMAERLEQTENMRTQLIGDVSHELRTPLTTIKGSMEGLIDGVLPPTPETFQNIHREADRLQRLVNDLQELSRVEAGAILLNLEPREIGPVIESVVQRLRSQFQEKEITLDIDISPSLPPVAIDEDRISQILINILGNALQYTPTGGEVLLEAVDKDNELEVRVTDTGVGISAEHVPHIFTRFYRVDKSRSRAGGGSGIGLTITKHLIEAHGGQIWAESDGKGHGSTFTFTLPIVN